MFLLLLCNDREVLGPLVNPRWLNVLAVTVVGALLGLSALLTATTIVPGLLLVPAVTGLAAAIAALAAGAALIAIRGPARPGARHAGPPDLDHAAHRVAQAPGPLGLAHAGPGRPALLPARRDHRPGRAGHPARPGLRLDRRPGTITRIPVGEEPPFVRLKKFMSNGWWFLLRTDGREQLRAAVQMLENIGMEAYAGRARCELRAAGGTSRQAAITAAVQLTAQ